MIKKEDLLQFTRATELVITQVDDESSDQTEVKILRLAQPITATGSNPTPTGGKMQLISNEVWVAADDIDEFLQGAVVENGQLKYKGPMHLDVSKPNGRTNANGEYVITKPAKVWLTKVKFSRSGGQLRTKAATSLDGLIANMFAGKPLDLTSPDNAFKVGNAFEQPAPDANGTAPTGNTGGGKQKAEPVVKQ